MYLKAWLGNTFYLFNIQTSLIEDDEEDDDERDSVEEDSELFLVTEIWVEPQCGTIMGSADNSYLSDLEYTEIPEKVSIIFLPWFKAFHSDSGFSC